MKFGVGLLGFADHRGEGGEGFLEFVPGGVDGGAGFFVEQGTGEVEGGEVVLQHGVLPGAGSEALLGLLGFADEGG